MKILNRVVCLCLSVLLAPVAVSLAQDDDGMEPVPVAPEFVPRDPRVPTPVMPGMPIPGSPDGGAPGGDPEAVLPTRVYVAEQNELSLLPRTLALFPGAVSLRASEEAFDANEGAKTALLNYVREGGTVFLHTGAARAFGFTTVEARPGSNDVAGQLFGRARAALPFAAHPLLWDDGRPVRRSPNYDPTLLPGVNLVYYQLQPGDHLVVSHPGGTPLLQVSDLAVDSPAPLYAAAIAPFGRGYAVFTPDLVDQKRADGALFARNLLGMCAPSKTEGRLWVGVPATAVENAANAPANLRAALTAAVSAAGPAFSPALPAFGTAEPPAPAPAPRRAPFDVAPLRPAAPAPVEAEVAPVALPPEEVQVFISRAEAGSYAAMLDAGGSRASAAIGLLRARLLLARGNGVEASRVIEATADFAPDGAPGGAEIALWRGILLAGASQELNQSSVLRANLMLDASRELARAANSATPGMSATANPATVAAFGRVTRLAGIPVAAIREWGLKFGQISQVFALEPPFVLQYGTGDSSIIVRGFQNDPALQRVALGVEAVAGARNVGWRGDREEVVIFPTGEAFTNYRTALGLQGPTVPMPAGLTGDVLGQRIIMLGVPATVVQTDPQTGGTIVLGGNSTYDVFARLHSYVLLNALDEGGVGIPNYLQLGLENLIARTASGNLLGIDYGPLTQFAQAGGLLTPEQFATPETDLMRYQIAQLQASAMLTYFYNEFGPGAVVETLQRLGAGQQIDEALTETTELNQLGLFQSWRNAQFGPLRLPNEG
jgi:hypothetical protein